MSQDGRPQYFPRSVQIEGEGPPGFDCDCEGWVYARRLTGFAKCSKGVVHCLICQRPAKRFRKGWVCSDKATCEEVKSARSQEAMQAV